MRYASGKTWISKGISAAILKCENEYSKTDSQHNNPSGGGSTLVSLFCGGLSVETKLAPYFDRVICNDRQEYLIALYKAVQDGWMPPNSITEEEYKRVKANKDADKALTGFIGFGCSFGGKWFGGYGRHGVKVNEHSMCEESQRAVLRDINILNNAVFTNMDYRDVQLPAGCVVYADPPYKNKMAAYGVREKFDSDAFWEWCREHSPNHRIYISELEAPDDFTAIWERSTPRQINNNQMGNNQAKTCRATEKLFVHRYDYGIMTN